MIVSTSFKLKIESIPNLSHIGDYQHLSTFSSSWTTLKYNLLNTYKTTIKLNLWDNEKSVVKMWYKNSIWYKVVNNIFLEMKLQRDEKCHKPFKKDIWNFKHSSKSTWNRKVKIDIEFFGILHSENVL